MAERPEPETEDKSREGQRDTGPWSLPHLSRFSQLLLTSSSRPPSVVVSCLRWSKPTKSLRSLKPEQHGGELNHTPASWEVKAFSSYTDRKQKTPAVAAVTWGRSRRRTWVSFGFLFFNPYNNSCNIMTPCPSNDRAYCNYMTFSPPKGSVCDVMAPQRRYFCPSAQSMLDNSTFSEMNAAALVAGVWQPLGCCDTTHHHDDGYWLLPCTKIRNLLQLINAVFY